MSQRTLFAKKTRCTCEVAALSIKMSFLSQLRSFSRSALKNVETKVMTSDGKTVVEHKNQDGNITSENTGHDGLGFVLDLEPDFQVGEVYPWLIIGSQDIAQSLEILLERKVTHIINLATGVHNFYPDRFMYQKLNVKDLPETNILQHFEECYSFIEDARKASGCVLVHCNAGVSRAATITISYVMKHDKISFDEAFKKVQQKRSCIRPNIGFTNQLKEYEVLLGCSKN